MWCGGKRRDSIGSPSRLPALGAVLSIRGGNEKIDSLEAEGKGKGKGEKQGRRPGRYFVQGIYFFEANLLGNADCLQMKGVCCVVGSHLKQVFVYVYCTWFLSLSHETAMVQTREKAFPRPKYYADLGRPRQKTKKREDIKAAN